MSVLHFLFLRAINTGSRRLTNAELLAPLIDVGYVDVAAYQAAGNVVFRSIDEAPVDVDDVERMLSQAYGFDTPVFVRSEAQLRSVIERCPFTGAQVAATSGKTQVTFLRSPAATERIAQVAAVTPDEDLVHFDGSEWFWLPVAGVSASTLPVPKIERFVGPMTMRTLGTLERMLAKFAG
ncbi:MAG: DUF1697 domain-containing protein [Ilumatobacter sp.]|uniref:DUF1697 domain-containing protein n=1 Tax=Ilumatobacter sp. TaxID=1967498 RepID=UPI003C74D09A